MELSITEQESLENQRQTNVFPSSLTTGNVDVKATTTTNDSENFPSIVTEEIIEDELTAMKEAAEEFKRLWAERNEISSKMDANSKSQTNFKQKIQELTERLAAISAPVAATDQALRQIEELVSQRQFEEALLQTELKRLVNSPEYRQDSDKLVAIKGELIRAEMTIARINSSIRRIEERIKLHTEFKRALDRELKRTDSPEGPTKEDQVRLLTLVKRVKKLFDSSVRDRSNEISELSDLYMPLPEDAAQRKTLFDHYSPSKVMSNELRNLFAQNIMTVEAGSRREGSTNMFGTITAEQLDRSVARFFETNVDLLRTAQKLPVVSNSASGDSLAERTPTKTQSKSVPSDDFKTPQSVLKTKSTTVTTTTKTTKTSTKSKTGTRMTTSTANTATMSTPLDSRSVSRNAGVTYYNQLDEQTRQLYTQVEGSINQVVAFYQPSIDQLNDNKRLTESHRNRLILQYQSIKNSIVEMDNSVRHARERLANKRVDLEEHESKRQSILLGLNRDRFVYTNLDGELTEMRNKLRAKVSEMADLETKSYAMSQVDTGLLFMALVKYVRSKYKSIALCDELIAFYSSRIAAKLNLIKTVLRYSLDNIDTELRTYQNAVKRIVNFADIGIKGDPEAENIPFYKEFAETIKS